MGPKAAQSFVILPQGYRTTGIPSEKMFGDDTLPDHEMRKPDKQRERERERERETTQNSELYYTRVKILGSCLFLQFVPANLHANRLHIKR